MSREVTGPSIRGMIRSLVRGGRRYMVRTLAKGLGRRMEPGLGSCVVVAPHPDDEVFGAGGMIALKRAAGVRVDVVFLTCGGASHERCCCVSRATVGANRRRLADKACGILGVGSECLHWFGWEDGTVPGSYAAGFSEAVAAVRAILEESGASEVYCPHPADVWGDHVAAAEIVAAAVAGLSGTPKVYHYLVWAWLNQPLHGLLGLRWRRSRRVDVGGVWEAKTAAMTTYLEEKAPGCGRPWVGALPADLLRAFQWRHEIVFDSDPGRGPGQTTRSKR